MRTILRSVILVVLLSIGFSPVCGAGLIILHEPLPEDVAIPHSLPHHPERPPHFWPGPHPMPRPIHRFAALEIKSLQAQVNIRDQVAQTTIDQEFYNPNPRQLEGTFLLPLPKGAHLKKFRMEVNGELADAELLAADKAKGIYEEIVRKAKDPALLEYLGRDLLKVRIFPIEPHSTKRIEVSYTGLVPQDAGLSEYILPLNIAKHCPVPIQRLKVEVNLESTRPLKTVYSPSHSVDPKREGDKSARITIEQTGASPEKDFHLFFSADRGELGLSFLTHKPQGEDGYFMLLATPGFENKSKPQPKDVIFVLDTSGSMNGAKLEQARNALKFCVNNLNDHDRFDIIRFSTEAEALFKNLQEVTNDTRAKALKFVEELKALGGTAIHDALVAALKKKPENSERPFLVVFLTDGLPTVGPSSEREILRAATAEAKDLTRLFCFGLGTDVNTHLLDKLAEETSAASQYVLPSEDIEIKVSSFFTKINEPALANPTLEIEGIHATRIHPNDLPDLFKGQQLIILGRYSDSGKGKARLSGQLGDEKKTFEYDLDFSAESTQNEFIPRIWANRRVGFLLDEIRLHGKENELKEEIITLAKKYGIVTPYTSYLVTEDQPSPGAVSVAPPQRMERLLRLNAASVPSAAGGPQARSGDAAVLASRYSSQLKEAATEEALVQSQTEIRDFAQLGLPLASTPTPAGQPALVAAKPAQPGRSALRFVGPRTFMLDDQTWVETAVRETTAKPRTIRFNSPEYWDLSLKHPELAFVFALGERIKFLLNGELIEIVPE